MHLSKSGKIFIGFLTILQLFVGLFLLIWIFSQFLPLILSESGPEAEVLLLGFIPGILIWIAVIAMLSLGILIFYIVHAATNADLSTSMKVGWVILLFFIGVIAQVVYYFMEILPARSITARLHTD